MNIAGYHTTARTHGQFGWVGLRDQQRPDSEPAIEAMSQGLNTCLQQSRVIGAKASCSTTGQIIQLEKQGFVAIFGSPFWKCASLQEVAAKEGNAAALARAYKTFGTECLDKMGNDFSVAIVDNEKNLTVLAVDHLARHPLYYYSNSDILVFGTSAESVLSHTDVPRDIDPQGIYNYVYFHMIPGPNSAFKNLRKLQAGKALVIKNGQQNIKTYWLPSFEEHNPSSFTRNKNQLRHNLTQSVKRAIKGTESVGAFLSGGLDSSTVTGILSERREIKPRAFSIGFDAEGYDEMAYARTTAKHFGVELNEYYVTPEDVVDALPLIATSYDEPFGNSSALPAWFCAKLAKDNGIDLLLAGDGGDELFAGNERYAKQKLFEIYGLIPKLIREGIIEPTANALADKVSLAQKAQSYIQQAAVPLPDRLQSYNFLHRHSPGEIFNKDFLGQISVVQPLNIQRDIYHAPSDSTALNRMLYLDWQITLADNDLRKVSHMCAMAGVDVSYPMLDDDLLDFSCTIPSQQKLKGQDLRTFYKKSLSGWLPDETINKSKQGFGLPFGIWMQEHKPLQEMAYDNLLALKERRMFNNEFLDHLITLHRDGHAAYYGVLVWILTVLELWMSRSKFDA